MDSRLWVWLVVVLLWAWPLAVAGVLGCAGYAVGRGGIARAPLGRSFHWRTLVLTCLVILGTPFLLPFIEVAAATILFVVVPEMVSGAVAAGYAIAVRSRRPHSPLGRITPGVLSAVPGLAAVFALVSRLGRSSLSEIWLFWLLALAAALVGGLSVSSGAFGGLIGDSAEAPNIDAPVRDAAASDPT